MDVNHGEGKERNMTYIRIKKEDIKIGQINFRVGIPVGNNEFGGEDYECYGVIPVAEDKDIVQLVPEFEGETILVNKSRILSNGQQVDICNGKVEFEFLLW
jgi:hypothetical protein